MSIIQYLRNNRLLVVGLVVAPAGLYSGIKIKEWQTQRKIDEVKRSVELAESKQASRNTADHEVRVELQGLRAARSMVRREEMQLEQELSSIALKLGRLDEREKNAEIRKESRDVK
ncbi:hypothetical protein GGI15_004708 [Coemansia interrupta]|uniref:Uncharacterized protein n=1 Tax=Coemansia interrupta TaxID=1126814 RepID=A0A9W8LFB7_9FUNG|nr:hypothetical protein GGI15_004708 [Coemansia interrupta]